MSNTRGEEDQVRETKPPFIHCRHACRRFPQRESVDSRHLAGFWHVQSVNLDTALDKELAFGAIIPDLA